jgi:hypothetical protein
MVVSDKSMNTIASFFIGPPLGIFAPFFFFGLPCLLVLPGKDLPLFPIREGCGKEGQAQQKREPGPVSVALDQNMVEGNEKKPNPTP